MSYLSLSDYGLIGNEASSALVSRLGSIDWLCFPFLDSPSHFGAILDENLGGRFQLIPQGDFRSEQSYIHRTHVLETSFETPHGRAVLLDWMPAASDSSSAPVLYRQVEVLDGEMSWLLVCMPRFEYGAQAAAGEFHGGQQAVLFRGPRPEQLAVLESSLVPLTLSANATSAIARFSLTAGNRVSFCWRWGRQAPLPVSATPDSTIEHWRGWAHRCPPSGCVFAGPWHDLVIRSSLVLKLLTCSFSGSIAEAITTSLPGISGEARTWDYRYAWIRDSALTIQALACLGYRQEAHRFFSWLSDIVIRDGAEALQPVYTLDGGKSLGEQELEFLSGYQGSRPVRVGNLSARQFQLDIYGHVMMAAQEYYRIFGSLPQGLWPRLVEIVDYVCQAWRRPDHGAWESRGRPEHYVSSKALCWAAIDRGIWLAQVEQDIVPPKWKEELGILHRLICEQGFDPKAYRFVRTFGDREIDSSSLLIPMVGVLPFEDPRIQGTLNAIQENLSNGSLLYRQGAGAEADGPHLVSSLLYVSCLALSGRAAEATDRLAEICTYATDLGFFGEQVNPATAETSGNFPSAAVHLALINAALYVAAAKGRQVSSFGLIGLPEAPAPLKKTA